MEIRDGRRERPIWMTRFMVLTMSMPMMRDQAAQEGGGAELKASRFAYTAVSPFQAPLFFRAPDLI